MTELLSGQTLSLAVYEPAGLLTAAATALLRARLDSASVRLQVVRCSTPAELAPAATTASLVFWRVANPSEIRPVCEALAIVRRRCARSICMVYVAPELAYFQAVLVEAGAQIVVVDVPSFHRALVAVLPKLPLSDQGFHPLTSGLTQRLPWPELAAKKSEHKVD